jgi:hypothetical protein
LGQQALEGWIDGFGGGRIRGGRIGWGRGRFDGLRRRSRRLGHIGAGGWFCFI